MNEPNDHLDDERTVALLDRGLRDVRMNRPLERIAARGATLRRRRRALPAGVTLLAVAATTAGVVLARQAPSLNPGADATPRTSAGAATSAPTATNTQEAGFSVRVNPATHKVTVPWDAWSGGATLEWELAAVGIHAVVQDLTPAQRYDNCFMIGDVPGSTPLTTPSNAITWADPGGGPNAVATIDPTVLPPDSTLNIVAYDVGQGPDGGASAVDFRLFQGSTAPACVPGTREEWLGK